MYGENKQTNPRHYPMPLVLHFKDIFSMCLDLLATNYTVLFCMCHSKESMSFCVDSLCRLVQPPSHTALKSNLTD